jgi:hypothetical protein
MPPDDTIPQLSDGEQYMTILISSVKHDPWLYNELIAQQQPLGPDFNAALVECAWELYAR